MSRSNPSTEWFRGLSEKDKKGLEETLRNSTYLLTHIQRVLTRRLEEARKGEISLEEFDNPSWAYKQAFTLGQIRATQDLLNLVSFIK